MTHQPLSTPFAFDTEFDAAGVVVNAAAAFRPIKRAYGPAEVEAMVAQARLEARNEALSEVDSIQTMSLSAIAQACEALGHKAVFLTDPGMSGVYAGYGFEEHMVNMSAPMPSVPKAMSFEKRTGFA